MKQHDTPHAKVTVRRAALDEIDAAREIIDEYCEAVSVLVRDDIEQLRHYFDDDSGVWIASSRDEIVGCIVMRPLPAQPHACEVKRLYVRQTYRGMGIADALLNAAETYAVERGYRIAYLDTKDDLHAAIRLYERRGYEPCERYNDNPQATVFMRRELRRTEAL